MAKIFNNNNLCEFWCRLPVGGGNTNSLLSKILPLSDHHSHFWATTSDFKTFFMLPFLHGSHVFYSLAFLCRYNFIYIYIYITAVIGFDTWW